MKKILHIVSGIICALGFAYCLSIAATSDVNPNLELSYIIKNVIIALTLTVFGFKVFDKTKE